MENNLARARARKAAMNWADWQAPKEAEGDTIRGTRVEAFEAGAAWAAQQALEPESDAELNEIVASLIRDAQAAGGDDAADYAAKRVAAYFAGIHGAEQDLWAVERATGQRQLDEAGALIRETATLLRGYEAHHEAKAQRASERGGRDLETEAAVDDARSKARRNGAMAARLEAWLAGEPLPGSMSAADQAAQEAFVSAALDAGVDQITEADEPARNDPDLATGCADDALPGTAEDWRAALENPLIVYRLGEAHDLVSAMAGAVLIEEGVGWVKVHGVDNAKALFYVLTLAKLANEAAPADPTAPPSAPWRTAGVADLAAFRITTPDPRFDPRAPATINGFLFYPAKED